MSSAGNYGVCRGEADGVEILRLTDAAAEAEVAIALSVGCNAIEFKIAGRNFIWAPYRPADPASKLLFFGNPFMEPFANRLSRHAIEVNGHCYTLNSELGNYLRDGSGLPMHGLISHSDAWTVTALKADAESAVAICRLEFWRHPDLMAQFPFAHAIEITHCLRHGVLEVETFLENLSAEPMPVSLGFHPFFQIPGAPRATWKVGLPADEEMPLSPEFFPSGQYRPIGRAGVSLALASMNEAYLMPRLHRGGDGRAAFWIEDERERVTIAQGPKYPVSVMYAPPSEGYVCFEPMTAMIDALNPPGRSAGVPLQSVPPGGTWRESFWISHTRK